MQDNEFDSVKYITKSICLTIVFIVGSLIILAGSCNYFAHQESMKYIENGYLKCTDHVGRVTWEKEK